MIPTFFSKPCPVNPIPTPSPINNPNPSYIALRLCEWLSQCAIQVFWVCFLGIQVILRVGFKDRSSPPSSSHLNAPLRHCVVLSPSLLFSLSPLSSLAASSASFHYLLICLFLRVPVLRFKSQESSLVNLAAAVGMEQCSVHILRFCLPFALLIDPQLKLFMNSGMNPSIPIACCNPKNMNMTLLFLLSFQCAFQAMHCLLSRPLFLSLSSLLILSFTRFPFTFLRSWVF